MTLLDSPKLVVERKISQPLEALKLVVRAPRLLRAGAVLALDDRETVLRFDRPFGVTLPPFGHADTSWSAPVSARTPRGHAVEHFELELNRWDGLSTELLVRPRATRPDRWGSGHLRRYFGVAHATADVMTSFLEHHALELSLHEVAPRGEVPSSRPSRATRGRAPEVKVALACSSIG